jgi:hypothetical protein
MSLTNRQKAAALHATISLGCMEALLQIESPKSARYNRISNAIDAVNKVVDLYRLEAFAFEDMENAGALLDTVNAEINRMYNAGNQ